MVGTEYTRERNRAERACGHLNNLLDESLPQSAQDYEVTHTMVDESTYSTIGDRPTYEFHLKSKTSDYPQVRVMILHGPNLRKSIPGGIQKERAGFHINLFQGNLERAIEKIESDE